jgi:hypothetical protein
VPVRHYVLLATDGFIYLPVDKTLCPSPQTKQKVYVFGFVGGLFKVDDKIINPKLDWTNHGNWKKLLDMKGTATIPSPLIFGEVGDRIYITLINLGMKERPDLMDYHTVHMHGAHVPTQLDGFPETSFGVPVWTDHKNQPPTMTYFFQPEHPGTLMYHCHVEASEHVQMGMYGALIIYPSKESLALAGVKQSKNGEWFYNDKPQTQIPKTATNRNFAYNDIHTYFDKEYVMLLSDIDSVWHESVHKGLFFNAANYKPDFWMINGRVFPDTLLPHPLTISNGEFESDLTQINYESYVRIKTDQQFLLRMINMGYQVIPWHIHGWHFTIIGKDSHIDPFIKLSSLLQLDDSSLHAVKHKGFTVSIGSGETYDLLLNSDDKRLEYLKYLIMGQDGFPSLCSQLKELHKIDANAIFNIPTEPVTCKSPELINSLKICQQSITDLNDQFFPQFYPMHNHDDYKITNKGIYPGGQLTYIQTDTPDYYVDDDLN